jgi:hypothetical protein
MTFMDRLLDDSELRERFSILGPKIEAFGPPPKQGFRAKHSFRPLGDVSKTDADTVLWKWQFANHDYVCRLRRLYPRAEHRAILLWRPWEDHARDWLRAYPNHDKGSLPANVAELKRQWRKLLGVWYRDIPDSVLPRDDERQPLEFEWVDASAYNPLDAWWM